MKTLIDEDLIPLREVPRLLPLRNGRRVSIDAVYRWARKGLAQGRLESLRIGGETYTSREAIARFATRLTNPAGPETPPSVVSRAHAEAARRLDDAGVS